MNVNEQQLVMEHLNKYVSAVNYSVVHNKWISGYSLEWSCVYAPR